MAQRPSRPNCTPTHTIPGSEERLRILEQRRAARQPLFHPNDRTESLDQGLRLLTARNGRGVNTEEAVSEKFEVSEGRYPNGYQPKKFATILRLARKKAGLSQAGLAARCGLSPLAIKRYESGERAPSFAALLALAQALSLPIRVGEDCLA